MARALSGDGLIACALTCRKRIRVVVIASCFNQVTTEETRASAAHLNRPGNSYAQLVTLLGTQGKARDLASVHAALNAGADACSALSAYRLASQPHG
jgi:hypothetical protein